MSFAARSLADALPYPAAITDDDGRVLVANARWPVTAADPDCPGHQNLPDLVRETSARSDATRVCQCDPAATGTLRVTALESTCGAQRRLITIESVPAGGGRDRLLGLLGPEIRTPAAAVAAAVDLLRGQALPDAAQETIDDIERTARGLQEFADDLAELARRETGEPAPTAGPVALRRVLEDVAESLRAECRAKGILLLTAPAPALPALVEGDAGVLRRVLGAVVGHAVRHTARGEIVVTAEVDGVDAYRIDVSADGDPQPDPGPDDRAGLALATRLAATLTGATTQTGLAGPTGAAGLTSHAAAVTRAAAVGDTSAVARTAAIRSAAASRGGTASRDGGVVAVESGERLRWSVRLPLQPLLTPDKSDMPEMVRGWVAIAVASPNPRTTLALTWLVAATGAEPVQADIADHGADLVLRCDDPHDPILTIGPAGPPNQAAGRTLTLSIPVTLDRLASALRQQLTSPPPSLAPSPSPSPSISASPALSPPSLPPSPSSSPSPSPSSSPSPSQLAGARPVSATLEPLPPGRVLLAEDDEVNRTVLQRMISVLGVECDTVPDGAAAVTALLGDTKYDLALLDMHMPVMDGLTATRAVRAAGSQVPIVALTATNLSEDQDRCLDAGMNSHLPKPVTLPELRRALEPYLTAPAAPPEPASGDVLSRAQLRELEEQLEGRELVAMTVNMFLGELDGRRQSMATALETGGNDRLAAVAHTLKSSSALLGAQTLADACARVERLASSPVDAGVLAAAVAEVDRAAAAAAIAMAEYFKEP